MNANGQSIASNSVSVKPSNSGPLAPVLTGVTFKTTDSMILTFTQEQNGITITNYKYSIDGGNNYTAFSPIDILSPVTISGLSSNTTYNISLKAIGVDGESGPSNVITETTYANVNYVTFTETGSSTWTAKESGRYWSSVSLSSTGQYQTAVANYGGKIYVSSDYGNTWTAKDSNRNWNSVSLSSTGQYQTAVVSNGQIYVSIDFGNTWTTKETVRNWRSVSISSSGQYQTACVIDGQIYCSSDYGNTWAAKESSRVWYSVSLSSTGQYMTAVTDGGLIYTSYCGPHSTRITKIEDFLQLKYGTEFSNYMA